MNVNFWVDPICPWCWMTARWIIEVVKPERDLDITWKSISLLMKNNPSSDNPFYKKMLHTNSFLRVMESVNQAEGNRAAFAFYWEAGRFIHHDKNVFVSAEEVLVSAGLSTYHAAAFDDEEFDTAVELKTNQGLELVGSDVGTPIISFFDVNGKERGIFGPVISEIPRGEKGLKLWDSMVTIATMDAFWELKRTRTVEPSLGEKPASVSFDSSH